MENKKVFPKLQILFSNIFKKKRQGFFLFFFCKQEDKALKMTVFLEHHSKLTEGSFVDREKKLFISQLSPLWKRLIF